MKDMDSSFVSETVLPLQGTSIDRSRTAQNAPAQGMKSATLEEIFNPILEEQALEEDTETDTTPSVGATLVHTVVHMQDHCVGVFTRSDGSEVTGACPVTHENGACPTNFSSACMLLRPKKVSSLATEDDLLKF